MNDRNPTATRPMMPSARARKLHGMRSEAAATSAFHTDSISDHSSSEPSCAPQTAV